MKCYPLVAALVGLVLASGLLIAIAAGRQIPQGPVYSVAQVQAELADQPQIWIGRAVRVRGIATTCPYRVVGDHMPCWSLALMNAGAAAEPLPVMVTGATGLIGVVRQLPLLRNLVGQPQVLRWGVLATYHVRLQAIPESSCGTGICLEAVLLDAAP